MFVVETLLWWFREVALQADHDDLYRQRPNVRSYFSEDVCMIRTSWVTDKSGDTTSYKTYRHELNDRPFERRGLRRTHATSQSQFPCRRILASAYDLLALIVRPKTTYRVCHLSEYSSANSVKETTDACETIE
jgi:hypothetical protein